MRTHHIAISLVFFLTVFVSCKNHNSERPQVQNVYPDIETDIRQYSGYELIWNDEFDVAGAPDKDKWGYELGYVRNHEPQLYAKDNVWCENGRLYIEASYQDGVLVSSSIETKGKADFLYGKIQARIKIPVGNSAWPAFWTLGSTRGWPDQGEVDIMEFYRYGRDVTPTILGNAFWVADDGVNVIDDTGTVPLSHFTETDPQWADKFHVWTEDWNENEMKIYVDDCLVNTIDLTQSFNEGGDHVGENPLRQPHYLKLNLAIRGRENDPVDPAALPMQMEVDWVRVYKAI